MTRLATLFLSGCLSLAGATVAIAQAPPTVSQPPAVPPPNSADAGKPVQTQRCTPTQAKPSQGTLAPHDTTTGQAPLSDKLAKSDGVLCPPPGIDSDIHAPTPNVGTMPVIPPPGSPGGDPSQRPK